MKTVLIRDDDVNTFTSVSLLNEVYGFIFDHNIPINFSVIPMVNASATTDSDLFGRGSYEPFIPVYKQGIDENYDISKNKELCDFLTSNSSFELLLHGFNHAGNGSAFEFYTENELEVTDKINSGMRIFMKAFNTMPKTFVAPQDKYSRTALKCITKTFDTFSIGWIDRSKLRLIDKIRQLINKKISKKNWLIVNYTKLLEHPGCCFSKFENVLEGKSKLKRYIENNDTIVVVVHHWEFYENGRINQALYDCFRDTILEMFNDREFRFINFRELT